MWRRCDREKKADGSARRKAKTDNDTKRRRRKMKEDACTPF
jgi:hypothetical protein